MATFADFKKLTAHAKDNGFIFQSSEIYDGLAATYDYGPLGVLLKNNLKQYWWRSMVQLHDNIVGIDAAIFMHPKTWKASGHVDAFNDPLVDSKSSNKRFRADVLVEDHIAKIEGKLNKEIEKAKKRFGDAFDETEFRATNGNVKRYQGQMDDIASRLGQLMTDGDMTGLRDLIIELGIKDPDTGSAEWTDVRQFNLMFSTQLGNVAGEEGKLYLRPETAQGIFVNFLNVQKSTRQKLPFGIAQIGKAFRNEIVARQFIFRMREFEQMEMQYFIKPGTQKEAYEYWKEARLKWHKALGHPTEKLRFHDHDNLAHYADAAVDIEFDFPFGFKELEGIHSRTDFDLSAHMELSGKKMTYHDPKTNEKFVPYVLETSIGADRLFLATMSHALQTEQVPGQDDPNNVRDVMKLHPAIAPIKAAIMPLKRNHDGIVEVAKGIFNDLRYQFDCQYDDTGAIGKLYRRQDAIGTPFCITVDFDTIEEGENKGTVTVRERDTLEQHRVKIEDLAAFIGPKVDMSALLRAAID